MQSLKPLDIEDVYKSIIENRKNYGEFHKCLFHVHTPESHDFRLIGNDKNYYRNLSEEGIFNLACERKVLIKELIKDISQLNCPDLFRSKKEYIAYLLIAQKLFQNEIKLVVVTDHNTIKGYEKLKTAIKDYSQSRILTTYPQVMLGVEISCGDNNHVVGIFNTRHLNSVEKWLNEFIMSFEDGTYETSLSVLSWISELNAIGYIAHIDTSNTFKEKYLNGAYKKKLFADKDVYLGLSNLDKMSTYEKNLALYKYKTLSFFYDCDAHTLEELDCKHFWIKGQKCNYDMLKNAIRDYSIAVRFNEPSEPTQYISGIVINRDEKSFLTPTPSKESECFQLSFSDSLNCFIGGRGVGKSTVLNIINFVLGQYLPYNEEMAKKVLDFICLHPQIVIYYRYKNQDYAIQFMSPTKEYEDDNVLKRFTKTTSFNQGHNYRYSFDRNEISDYSVRNYITIYKLSHEKPKIEISAVTEKKKLLNDFFNTGFAINDLVQIANSDSISSYIHSIIFKNEALADLLTDDVTKASDLTAFLDNINLFLQDRANTVNEVLNKYNTTQENKLKINYSQKLLNNVEINFNEIVNTKSKGFKKYNILSVNLVDYFFCFNKQARHY